MNLLNLRKRNQHENQQGVFFFVFLILLLLSRQSFSQKGFEHHQSNPIRKTTAEPSSTMLNINNMSMWATADAQLVIKDYPFSGLVYPRGTAGVVYQDGIFWGGIVHDGKVIRWHNRDYKIRVGGHYVTPYSRIGMQSGLRPGRILMKGVAENPNDPDVRIWRIRRDWRDADLTLDASEFFQVSSDRVTQKQIDEVRNQYESDWNEWPWQKGAPFYDANGNEIMDDGEEPGYAFGDQVVWFVANDLDSMFTKELWGSSPFGMEMQVTLWAYHRMGSQLDEVSLRISETLDHIIFKRLRFIYKGCMDTPDSAYIDNMYLGQGSDIDIGNAGDDVVGCDTTLNLGYAYNGNSIDNVYSEFGLCPPSIGYAILQGPIVYSKGGQALYDMKIKIDYENLSLASFSFSTVGSPIDPYTPPYEGALRWYKKLRGFAPLIGPEVRFNHPPGVTPGPFPLSGDPVKGTGHIDGQGEDYSYVPGDRCFTFSMGPFTMCLGDTQEVIIALIGGIGSGRLASVSVMKHHAKWAHLMGKSNFGIGFREDLIPDVEPVPQDYFLFQNYPNPFNAGTVIRYDLPVPRNVKLAVYNLLGQEVRVLVNEIQEASGYAIRWDGTNGHGEKVPSGLYIFRLEAGSVILSRKMLLLY